MSTPSRNVATVHRAGTPASIDRAGTPANIHRAPPITTICTLVALSSLSLSLMLTVEKPLEVLKQGIRSGPLDAKLKTINPSDVGVGDISSSNFGGGGDISSLVPKPVTLRSTGHAVVHMGIHKTGTSSIQRTSNILKRDAFERDGFEMPWFVNMEHNARLKSSRKDPPGFLDVNQVNFATCFVPPSDEERRRPDLLLHGLDIASRNRNLFVSAETFDKIDFEGVDRLAHYLSHWQKTIIVVFYRRYYDWMVSWFNQNIKYRSIKATDKWEVSVLDTVLENVNHVPVSYISELVPRLRRRFDDILVVNYHDKSGAGSVKALFCHPSLNMTHSCETVSASTSTSANIRADLDYADLAYGAKKAGLININSDQQMRKVAQALQDHHKVVLNNAAFKRVCPPDKILGRLWDMTLKFEKMFLPNDHFNESELRSDFDKHARTTLCKLDVASALSETSWVSFFVLLH